MNQKTIRTRQILNTSRTELVGWRNGCPYYHALTDQCLAAKPVNGRPGTYVNRCGTCSPIDDIQHLLPTLP